MSHPGLRQTKRPLLCDATDETSGIDMLCHDNKAGGSVSTVGRLTVIILRIRGDPRRRQSEEYLLTVVNLLYDNIWSSSRTPGFPGHPFGPRFFLFHP
jgi:hypothetical protein